MSARAVLRIVVDNSHLKSDPDKMNCRSTNNFITIDDAIAIKAAFLNCAKECANSATTLWAKYAASFSGEKRPDRALIREADELKRSLEKLEDFASSHDPQTNAMAYALPLRALTAYRRNSKDDREIQFKYSMCSGLVSSGIRASQLSKFIP